MAGVGIKQVSSVKQMLGKITSLDSNNYPEMLGKTCIINAPSGFGVIFGVVKPFLDARTRAKVEVGSFCSAANLACCIADAACLFHMRQFCIIVTATSPA